MCDIHHARLRRRWLPKRAITILRPKWQKRSWVDDFDCGCIVDLLFGWGNIVDFDHSIYKINFMSFVGFCYEYVDTLRVIVWFKISIIL